MCTIKITCKFTSTAYQYVFWNKKKQTEMIKITALAKEKSNNSKYLSISYHIATKHKNQF